ncbi:hypothetical protein PPERSA_10272 [Pseudocohnilembus persalinus]|uniref:Uncharacterized protein n=1 Tax=Pseudocohnilembus persalinus TaxID=266149 RepID=A0A0V0R037_PSEPJ|nr:hypothetical protein PPERSA_10272 [Pseudocohnilembus persalinus]|eukprot:KRX07884.1 hypothetical protein PPERSA_10272 [Pseudocohnilembus persalinus]
MEKRIGISWWAKILPFLYINFQKNTNNLYFSGGKRTLRNQPFKSFDLRKRVGFGYYRASHYQIESPFPPPYKQNFAFLIMPAEFQPLVQRNGNTPDLATEKKESFNQIYL